MGTHPIFESDFDCLTDMSGKVKFFKKAHFFWIAAITGGMTLLGLCHYSPESVPHKNLRPIGILTEYLCNEQPVLLAVTWYSAILAHVGEAIYAYKLSSELNIEFPYRIAWFVQTLLFGYASLHHLIAFRKIAREKEKILKS